MFAVGLSQGPLHHYWYGFLDRALPSRSRRTVGLKILADQLAAAPFFAVTFFYGMGLLQGKSLEGCWTEFVAKFPAVYLVRLHIHNDAACSIKSMLPRQCRPHRDGFSR